MFANKECCKKEKEKPYVQQKGGKAQCVFTYYSVLKLTQNAQESQGGIKHLGVGGQAGRGSGAIGNL